MFVVAYPLAPCFALANNYIEVRVDAIKLCKQARRPEPKGAEDIGTWYFILNIMSSLAILTNCAVLFYTSTQFKLLSSEAKVWLFFLTEHVLLSFRSLLSVIIPDMPEAVDIQLQRQQFLVDKIIECVPDDEEVHKIGDVAAEDFDDDYLPWDDEDDEQAQASIAPSTFVDSFTGFDPQKEFPSLFLENENRVFGVGSKSNQDSLMQFPFIFGDTQDKKRAVVLPINEEEEEEAIGTGLYVVETSEELPA